MSIGTASAGDPQRQPPNTNGQVANVNTSGLTAVSPALVAGERTLVLIAAGQSNSANWQGDPPYLFTIAQTKVHMMQMQDGSLWRAAEPLLGADGGMSSYVSRLANDLVANGVVDRVIVLSVGAGGTYIADWDITGGFHCHLTNAVSRAKSLGWLKTSKSACILWTQGEADAQSITPQAQYEAALRRIQASCEGLGFGGPIFVTKATWVNGLPANSAPIRAAQAAVVDNVRFRAGFDMDTLDNSMRRDTVHLSAAGAQAKADGYRTLIASWLSGP